MSVTDFHHSAHLSAEALRPAGDRCPVCLDVAARRAVLRLQDDPPIDYLECGACGACSTSAMPTDAYLERYYRRFYAKADSGVTFRDSVRFSKKILAVVRPLPRGGAFSILDFGGGDGGLAVEIADQLLRAYSDLSVTITVVDYSQPQESRDERVSIAGATDLAQVDERFDLVLASAVLEHVPEVHDVLRALLGRALPGGHFYARTPHSLPLKRVLPSYDLLFPAHVHDMGSDFWDNAVRSLKLPGQLVLSRPSMVESLFREDPLRTFAAHLLKLPARVERVLRRGREGRRWWRLVGGWEVVIRRD